jgi:hypothetical protein
MKPRRVSGIAAAALTVAGALKSQAADLSTWSARQFFPPPFTWTGSYVGLNAGGVWGSGSRSTTLYDAGFPLLQPRRPLLARRPELDADRLVNRRGRRIRDHRQRHAEGRISLL